MLQRVTPPLACSGRRCEAPPAMATPPAIRPRKPPSTRLQRQLASPGEFSRSTPLDAFRLARRKFLAGERIDMGGLADELGVNRVTLYRWAGSRAQLLVEVVWSVAARTLETIDPGVRA